MHLSDVLLTKNGPFHVRLRYRKCWVPQLIIMHTLGHLKSVFSVKSTKVQTLGAVTLRATTDCTDDASIVGLGPLNWAIV